MSALIVHGAACLARPLRHDGPMKPVVGAWLLLSLACAPKPGKTFVPIGVPDGSVWDGGVTCQQTCSSWTNERTVGSVLDPVKELSGLAASRTQANVLYAHNDSGDQARFWAISATNGTVMQQFLLEAPATNVDWEDAAMGPCPNSSAPCLFIGDVGDNSLLRTSYALYVVPEPLVTAGGKKMSVPFQTLPFTYPNGDRKNSEAILVDPTNGRPYVITKEDVGRASLVYRFPLPLTPGVSVELELVGASPVPASNDLQLTGADASPCGDAILLRTYGRLWMLRASDLGLESAFASTPINMPVLQEDQGEAVAFAADGRSYFTSSETIVDPAPLNSSTCR